MGVFECKCNEKEYHLSDIGNEKVHEKLFDVVKSA